MRLLNKLLRRLGLKGPKPENDFSPIVKACLGYDFVLSNKIPSETGKGDVELVEKDHISGQYLGLEEPDKDLIFINFRSIMVQSEGYEEVLTRVIENEIHELMHWGDYAGSDKYDGVAHQVHFNEVIHDLMSYCDQDYHDIRYAGSRFWDRIW